MSSTNGMAPDIAEMLAQILKRPGVSRATLVSYLGTSRIVLHRWLSGETAPSVAQRQLIMRLFGASSSKLLSELHSKPFASRGVRRTLPLFKAIQPVIEMSSFPQPPIYHRLKLAGHFNAGHDDRMRRVLAQHPEAATLGKGSDLSGSTSAGKNTYTYDAHTYHTKVPPQGISEIIKGYLPKGGIILDPFAGSGMTGVAARVAGVDCILNELSPAACFIADRFTSTIDPGLFESAVDRVIEETNKIRKALYSTKCRECGRTTELLYTVWSYDVICPSCQITFTLWDHCRSYGRTVRDHKLLSEFPCPTCSVLLKKSRLQRTIARPVAVGYKCCGSRQQEVTYPPSEEDVELIDSLEQMPLTIEGFYPKTKLGPGVNLSQPIRHGLDRVDRFYTARNLSALSHLWYHIHRIVDVELAGFLAFAFTSLYQRATRMSEFRFWGGSGNTARFNVPYIFNETNVFAAFHRKSMSILDHLQTTALQYTTECVVNQGSATELTAIPDESVDLIFTDPPFGANINYSEMNIIWESWLDVYTDTTEEVIVNRHQGKGIAEYQSLMSKSFQEAYRTLRPGHPMIVIFMNSSADIWQALRSAIVQAGFVISKIDQFDKQHGTFKQFVSENTAGLDLILHCRKSVTDKDHALSRVSGDSANGTLRQFLESWQGRLPVQSYLHVSRGAEIDYRHLYSQWTAECLANGTAPVSFPWFREVARQLLDNGSVGDHS